MAFFYKPLTRKPSSGPIRLDPSNPLTAGIVSCYPLMDGYGPPLDIVGNPPRDITNLPTWTQGPSGLAAYNLTVSNATTTDLAFSTTGLFSVAVLFNVTDASGTGTPTILSRSAYTSESVNTGWQLTLDSGGYNFNVFANNAFSLYAVSTGSAATLGDHLLVGTCNGTNKRSIYLDGTLKATATTSLVPLATVGNIRTNNSTAAPAYLIVIWNRVLSDGEVTLLARNPWQILASQRSFSAFPTATPLTLAPATGSIVVTGFAPSANMAVAPAVGSVVVTGFAPSLAIGITVAPAAGSVVLAGFAPRADVAVAPAAGSVVITGFAPSLAIGITVAPAAGSIVITGFAPTAGVAVSPATGSAVVTGFAPTLAIGITLAPAAGAVALTGFAPSSDIAAAPSAGTVVVTGFAPTSAIGITVAPSVGSIVVTGFAPAVDNGQPVVQLGATVPGPADGQADIARRKWLEWAAKRKKRVVTLPARKVTLPAEARPSAPVPVPERVTLPSLPDQLLAANLRAVAIRPEPTDGALATVAALREAMMRAREQDEDDIEMLLLSE